MRQARSFPLLVLMLAWLVPGARAWATGPACPENSRELYYACSACHWDTGEGNEALGASALAGLDQAYLVRQTENFKLGVRGKHPDDSPGQEMVLLAKMLRDSAAVAAMACYAASLPPTYPPPTLKGDAGRGKALYAACADCHGERARGDPESGAPALVYLNDWYLESQLKAYRAGWQGTHPDDRPGRRMARAAAKLPDDRAVTDVVAYIMSLR